MSNKRKSKDSESSKNSNSKSDLIAKKDHVIFRNGFRLDIKVGDNLNEVPEEYLSSLKTEKVI